MQVIFYVNKSHDIGGNGVRLHELNTECRRCGREQRAKGRLFQEILW